MQTNLCFKASVLKDLKIQLETPASFVATMLSDVLFVVIMTNGMCLRAAPAQKFNANYQLHIQIDGHPLQRSFTNSQYTNHPMPLDN